MIARVSAFLILAALFAAIPVSASERYDPRLRFRTISTRRFDIHFHQREDGVARRLAAIIEETAADVDKVLGPANGRVQVILVDQSDLSNGWASTLPYNTIELGAAAPAAMSVIGNTDDWLRIVFTHEYTHIVHLSRAGGWIGGLRRVFGRLPLLFPNQFQPLWQIEGIATWQESARTNLGRIQAGDFRNILGAVAAAKRFDPLDRASSRLTDWPAGNTPYLYGGFFHEYLARKYGDESLRRLTDATSGRLPYFGAPAFKKVFGRSLGQLWADFERENPHRELREFRADRLTRDGFNVSGPRFSRDGQRVYYSVSNPHGFPTLMELDVASARTRTVAPRFLGNTIGLAGDRLVIDQIELEQSVGLRSDLYAVDPATGDASRLSTGARAIDPDVSPDGTTIAFVVQAADRRLLATVPVRPSPGASSIPAVLVSEPNTDYASPRWSLDGSALAVERRTLGGPSEIVVLDAATGARSSTFTSTSGRAASPVWTPDGRSIMFTSTVDGGGFRIISVDVATGVARQLEGTGPSVGSFDLSPDGTRLVFVGLTADGHDLFSLRLDAAQWSPLSIETERARDWPAVAADTSELTAPAYSPWRTLVPRFWTPTIESDEGEVVVGAATGGVDALGRHGYAIEAGWSTRARPDWQVAYAYDRWRPTLFVAVSDDTDPWRDGEIRSLELNAGMFLPFRRIRWSHTALAAFDSSSDTFDCPNCDPALNERVTRRSVQFGWNLTTARIYGYSVSPEEGGAMTVTTEVTRAALGADGDGTASSVDLRWYLRARPRHAVIAARVAAAGSWGDERARRIFSASGAGPQGAGFDFGTGAVGLIRGIDEGDISGTRALVMNLDYRLPLKRIDRGAGTIPLFLRTLHGAVFVDAGHAWTERYRSDDLSVSIGGELSVDTFVGYALPLTFSAGAAWRDDRVNGKRGVVAFGRIGRAF